MSGPGSIARSIRIAEFTRTPRSLALWPQPWRPYRPKGGIPDFALLVAMCVPPFCVKPNTMHGRSHEQPRSIYTSH